MLHVRGLTVGYGGTPVLDGVDLEIQKGQFASLIGPSGSGKTSVLRVVTELISAEHGSVELDVPMRDVAFLFQDDALLPWRTVRQNVALGLHIRELPEATVADKAEHWLTVLGLAGLGDRYPAQLSGGQRKRAAIAQVLALEPKLLLLDEPFASLDLALRRKLLPFLRRLRTEFHIPMLFVSHDPIEVQAVCDDLIVLKDGGIIAQGEPRQVLTETHIFPLAEQEGFENILPCHLVEGNGSTSRVRLGEEAGDQACTVELVTLGSEAEPGDAMLAGIPANDIMLATKRPEGLSARNVLPARITELRSVGSVDLVTAEISPDVPPLTVEVTEKSFVELGLQVGGEVFLVIKATSCRLYESGLSAL